jgi:hypothetical protein
MRKRPGLALTAALGRRGQVVEHDGQRQEGHEELERIELSTHMTWNPCPHCGITHTTSRSPNCARKTMHSASSSSAALRHHAHHHTLLRLPPPRPRKSASAAPCTFFVSPLVGVELLRLRSRRRLGAPQRRLGCSWGRWSASVGPDAPVAPGVSARRRGEDDHDIGVDARVRVGRRNAQYTVGVGGAAVAAAMEEASQVRR